MYRRPSLFRYDETRNPLSFPGNVRTPCEPAAPTPTKPVPADAAGAGALPVLWVGIMLFSGGLVVMGLSLRCDPVQTVACFVGWFMALAGSICVGWWFVQTEAC